MKPLAVTAGALALASIALSGCVTAAGTGPSASSDIGTALAVGCPILSTVQSSGLPLNSNQKAALQVLALACPPNPPPTSALVAVGDLISAYSILRPLAKP